MGAIALIATNPSAADWPSAGADLQNSRYQSAPNNPIQSQNVGKLKLKWTFATDGDVTAHPTVDGDFLYFPDSAGFLYKVNKNTGAQVWKRPISDYTNIPGDSARGSPAVAGDLLILGNLIGRNIPLFGQPVPPSQPARVFALDKNSGNPVWSTKVDQTDLAFVTQSPIVFNDTVYVGVAANEEVIAAFKSKADWQWQFRSSTVALNVKTGQIKWRTFMIPPRPAGYVGNWYAGAGIWGSTGAVDQKNRLIFMTTGNNTMVSQTEIDCRSSQQQPPSTCSNPGNFVDAVVALDLDTGAVKWVNRGLDYDTYNIACGLVTPAFSIPLPTPPFPPGLTPGYPDNCPYPLNSSLTGPDWDFAQGAMLLGDDLVGAGQKSGVYWVFNRKTGALVWRNQIVPGGITGGMQWGSAFDGSRIFVANANSGSGRQGGPGPGVGGWAAMDRKTGAVLWTKPDPMGSRAEAAVSATNDVVFGCNLAGTMFAMHAKTGATLWSYDSGGTCNAAASISDGMVFWGSGNFSGFGTPKKIFAFGL
jgi:polyvinyl alcohol dehydrogenase (cytochrome)